MRSGRAPPLRPPPSKTCSAASGSCGCRARRKSWRTRRVSSFMKPSRSFTGNFLIDDTFLAAEGITDFEKYRVDAREPLAPTFFVPDDAAPPPGVSVTGERWE